jgi:hypothetical protein
MALPRRLTSALEALTAAVETLEEAAACRLPPVRAGDDDARDMAELRDQHASLLAARAVDGDRIATLLRVNDDVGLRLERVATALRALAERQDDPSPADGD